MSYLGVQCCALCTTYTPPHHTPPQPHPPPPHTTHHPLHHIQTADITERVQPIMFPRPFSQWLLLRPIDETTRRTEYRYDEQWPGACCACVCMIQAWTRTRTHIDTHIPSHTHTRTSLHTHLHTHNYIHAHTHIVTPTYTHSHTYMHTFTYMHTYTYTRTPTYYYCQWNINNCYWSVYQLRSVTFCFIIHECVVLVYNTRVRSSCCIYNTRCIFITFILKRPNWVNSLNQLLKYLNKWTHSYHFASFVY